ncbi:MAG: DUF1573 domain-containing protein [Desulfovibrio sp.]
MNINRMLLAIAFLIVLTCSPALAAGKLIVNENQVVFGNLVEGVVARKIVTLTNNGDAALTIGNVSTSCSCTTTKLERPLLEPGESTILEIVYNTYKFPGKFEKYVYVQWGEGKAGTLTITMQGDVTPIPMGVLTAEPRKVIVGAMRVGEPKEAVFAIINTGDAAMQVTKVVSKKSGQIFFDAADKGAIVLKPGQSVQMPVSVRADKAGSYVEYIIIDSDARNVTHSGYKVVLVGNAE